MAFLFGKKSPDFESLSDQDIVQLYRNSKNTQLIGVLFQRYAHLVYGITVGYFEKPDDRNEAVMDVFEKLYGALLDFEITNFKSWLYSVAKNQCLMMIRKNNTRNLNEKDLLKNFQEEFMEFDVQINLTGMDEKSIEEKLRTTITKLNQEQRVCVEMFYFQNMSYKQIADQSGYSLNQVKSFIQNGKRNLKIMLEEVK